MAESPWWEREEWKKKLKKLEEESKKLREKRLREERVTLREKPKSPRERVESAPNKPVDLTDDTFPEAVQKRPLVVVDCWAPWCGPCQMVSPIVEEMAQDYAGRIFFGKLNLDENRGVAMQYQIMSIPTLLVFQNGKLVDQIIGAMPRQMLEPKITRYLRDTVEERNLEEDVCQALDQVMHPEIDYSLVDLGMIKDVAVENKRVTLTLALPFLEIPIKGDLTRSLKETVKKLDAGMEVDVKLAEMSLKERTKFMTMAQEKWKL